LSKDTAALLKKIDNANIGYRQWDDERKQLVSNYLAINAQIREKLNYLENESLIRGELDDIGHKLSVFEERGYSDILTRFSTAQRDEDLLEFWKSKWIDSSEKLSTICQELTPSEIDNKIFENSPDFKETHDEIIENFTQIQNKIKTIVEELNRSVQISVKKIEDSTLSRRIKEDQAHYQTLKQKLESEGTFVLNEFNDLLKRKQDLILALGQIDQHKQDVSELNTAKERCFEQLIAKRKEIQSKRSRFLAELLSGNQLIEIKIIPFGEPIVKIESEFRKLIEKEDGRFEKDISRLLKKIEEDPISGLTLLKETLRQVRNHNYSHIEDSRFGEHIERLDPEKIDRIICYFPEDSLDVKYYDQKKGGLISISQGSPGQRNAALLAFLLIYGNEPLILDQPEDDLDNQLIYDSIVAQLREIKIKRQVIIVTHNANVVVNGDSENVIPLSVSSSAQTVISGNGSLQEPDVRIKVCEILEGGKEAFESRYRRINVGE
jgi:hypothetical protein